jgi:predicted amidohydrolase YtcJ
MLERVVSREPATVLVHNAEVGGRGGVDVRVGQERIEQLAAGLTRRRGEQVVDAHGGAVIPGLHDHHVHLRSVVAARRSVDASAAQDRAAFDRLIAAAAAAAGPTSAAPGGWLRVTGWNEHRAGMLDRRRLDALAGAVPTRVQHRSGAMWVLNSAAMRAVGADHGSPSGVERDRDGAPTGRLLRIDAWLRGRLAAAGASEDNSAFAEGLAAYATWCERHGITGFTDATPGREQADADEFARLADAGTLPQRLVLMAPPGVRPPSTGRVTLGPVKVVLDDATLPAAAELAAQVSDAHGCGLAVAVHCVTAEQLVVAVAAFEQAAPAPAGTADRIEHAGVVPPGYAASLARLGLAVVTQPGFLHARGDDYQRHVPAAEQGWLYPCASLLRAGVAVAAGSDAPFGPASPWASVAAATTRRTSAGTVIGPAERVTAAQALRLFLAAPDDVRRLRSIAPGQPGDICVLHGPIRQVLADPAATQVQAAIIGAHVHAAR